MRFDKNNDLLRENAAIVSQILSTTVVTTVVLMEICLENLYVDIGAESVITSDGSAPTPSIFVNRGNLETSAGG